MRFILGVVLAVVILIFGGLKAIERKNVTSTVTEILDFISLVKTEVDYLSAECDTIYKKGSNRNYKFIVISDNKLSLREINNSHISELFSDFIDRLGTTDKKGQLSLCDEYKHRFEEILKQRLERDKEKLQVNTALSLLGAICVLVVFSW